MLESTRLAPCLARPDPKLKATVVARRPLIYRDGAQPRADRPAHVRAGSSIARVPSGLAIVQDDANFVALVSTCGEVMAIDLPPGVGGVRQFDDSRGNKRLKADLEACFAVPSADGTVLIALGSGSSPLREGIVTIAWVEPDPPQVVALSGHALYAALRHEWAAVGARTNIEGAVPIGDHIVRLLTRGTGRPLNGIVATNATCDVDRRRLLAYLADPRSVAPPEPANVRAYELGSLDGIALGFTDATPWSDTWLYSATGEDTADAVDDGPVVGSAIGIVDRAGEARWTAVTETDGQRFLGKIEGLVADDSDPRRLLAVIDSDEPETPSSLCTLQLDGTWLA